MDINSFLIDANNGMKNKDLAEKHNLTVHQVARLKRKHNVKHSQKIVFTEEQNRNLIKMFKEGYTLKTMGEEFGVTGATIKKILKGLGYEFLVEKKMSYDDLVPKLNDYINDYENSEITIKELCDKYNISIGTHTKIVDEFKLEQRSPRLENELTEIQLKSLEKDITDGMYITHLAEKYNVYASKITRYAKDNDLLLTNGNDERRFNYDESEIVRLFDEGLLIKEIADKLNIEYYKVQFVLNQHGKSRSESEVYEMMLDRGSFGGGYKGKRYPYKGYKMRSKWEVNVAKYLDKHNYNWEYEIKTFKLGDFRYTPDFFILDEKGNIDFIIEVKGWVKEKDIRKLQLMEALYPEYPIVFIDREPYRLIEKEVA